MRTCVLAWALLLAGSLSIGERAMAEAIPVELEKTEQGWQLLRDGEPYFIRGAGGQHSLQQLAAAGGNSVRTWGGDDIGPLLDEAHSLGLSVTVGIWLGHERQGFDYNDETQVAEQLQHAREMVLKFRDHPALLLWGIGNEMEGYEEGDDAAIWAAVNDVAAMVKELDPAHPTMTVTAELGGGRIDSVHRRVPAIDIHGINSYGGVPSLAERLRAGGATKPYVITEFGPVGTWEMPKTEWSAPYEQTSTEKAAFYRESYNKGIIQAPEVALGSYVFLWGHKMEGTETWFGMFLEDGSRTAAVDVMTELWSGESPADLAPTVERLVIDGNAQVDPGDVVQVSTATTDPEGTPVSVRWVLRPESGDYATGGDFRPNLPEIEGAVLEGRGDGARLRMPEEPGSYRLFLYAYDEAGNAATANVPLLVKGKPRMRLPVSVYEDSFEAMPWAPSGWMGSTEFLTLDGSNRDNPHEGVASVKMRYEGKFGWVGVAWQHPANNWGDQEGGFDLSGASELEFWARGEYGGEKISFGVGLLEEDRAHPDSGIMKVEGVELSREWQRYSVPLKKLDLSSIKTGFFVSLTGRSTPATVYLDSIRFIR
ncbi:MAG: glycoside hydrolase family 2 TIM barrel-domain containing protein [Woeseiaceae bacterium]|nr:glycoside hydrolase family 2 TIM barrel-domain containing protein [Woeseiaceae bacterium]MDX2608951.1 glycoside hydrolase family 2 TIM barrel-domain containing protein [Woeseiaceae bacterium]